MQHQHKQNSFEKPFVVLVAIFIGGLTIASVLANKILSVFGLFVPAGVVAYSITFIATDTISEIWGKVRAQWVVFSGFVALIVVLVLINLAVVLPAAPFWENQQAFKTVLQSTSRIIIASFIAYLVSQFHDVWAFHFWKKVTHNKHLWLRNNLSTMVSQLLDTVIFIIIAFYGIQPVWQLIFGQYIVKLAIAVVDTPLVYLLVHYVRKRD